MITSVGLEDDGGRFCLACVEALIWRSCCQGASGLGVPGGAWWLAGGPWFPGRREWAQLFGGDARLIFEGWVPHDPVFVAVRGLGAGAATAWWLPIALARTARRDELWPSGSRARPGSTGPHVVVPVGLGEGCGLPAERGELAGAGDRDNAGGLAALQA